MTADPVIQSDGMLWAMNSARSSDETAKYSPVAKSVLIEVKNIFDEIFGAEAVNAHKHLLIEFTAASNPEISAGKNLIQLVAPMNCPLAIIFEFAHELCHVMADAGAPESYKWFEETLCQLMSFHALRRFRDHLAEGKLPQFSPLINNIEPYIQKMFKCKDMGGKSFPVFFHENLPHLMKERYDRDMNHTIARQLDGLFTESPEFWKIVPVLSTINPDRGPASNMLALTDAAGIPDRDSLIACLFE